MISKSVKLCACTLSIACSTVRAALKTGTMTETRGIEDFVGSSRGAGFQELHARGIVGLGYLPSRQIAPHEFFERFDLGPKVFAQARVDFGIERAKFLAATKTEAPHACLIEEFHRAMPSMKPHPIARIARILRELA